MTNVVDHVLGTAECELLIDTDKLVDARPVLPEDDLVLREAAKDTGRGSLVGIVS